MITISNLGFGYRKSEALFEGLDLSIQRGGIYGLLGRNGAGKSTLLKLITGCLEPREGSILTFGEEAFRRDPEMLRRLFFLPEQVHLPAQTWSGMANAYGSFYPNFDRGAFFSGLERFSVPTDRNLTKLSLGQKKKGLICFALACNTELLVLDEPTNGLDIPSKAQFRSILAEAVTDERAIVVSTHQVRDLAGLIDPIIVVDEGRVVAEIDLMELSKIFAFDLDSGMKPPTDALYAERVPGGHYVVRPNLDGRHTEPDLEVLFNAVVMPQSPVLRRLNAAAPQPV